MFSEIKRETKKIILLSICVLLFIVLFVLVSIADKKGFSTFNGVLSALQYGVCLLMLHVDKKKGIKVAIVAMGINFCMFVRVMFVGDFWGVLPGVFNAAFYIITLLLVYRENVALEKISVTDILTGLYNLRGFYSVLQNKIEKEDPFHVIYFVVDNFNEINSNYGHKCGDELMQIISKRMSDMFGDNMIISRATGIDFAIILDGESDAEQIARELLKTIRERISIKVDGIKKDCYLKCYAGITSYPKDTMDYELLINYANIAMLEAKADKSKIPYRFEKQMAEYLNRQFDVEKIIKQGLENDYFYLVYQPQYSLDGKKLRGFETLIRLKTPDGMMISPGEFIPIAEKGDLVLQIDDYVIKRAIKEFKDIVKEKKDLIISVNVSAKNISSSDFVEKIKKMLTEAEFPTSNFEIEITEYCLVQSMQVVTDNIIRLKDMGIRIALDDFGTGYTSLNYVAKLPIDLLKIDKSLIDDIEEKKKGREFVRIVISMGHLMGCEVIAEGVEDKTQIEYLKEDECDMVQGYVWGKPLEYHVAKALINNTYH